MRRPADAELQAFLETCPDARYVDALFFDLCGSVRGKRYPREDLGKLFAAGFPMPHSIYLLDVTGENSDAGGRGISDGDPDGVARPLPGTLVPVPWASAPAGQVLMTLEDEAGRPSALEPRNVAARVLEGFTEELGLVPCVAFELEFYLLDPEPDAAGRPRPPLLPGTEHRADSTQVYGMDDLEDFAAFFDGVREATMAQGIPATVAVSEYAAAQFEVNLRHVDSPLEAADHCAMFRHLIKRVAARHGMRATFMPKPFPDQTGSGMHVHMSLLDAEGRNVCDDGSALGSPALASAVGGLLDTMHEAMAFFVPSINGYRRFVPGAFVPVGATWGANNRSVACRIPAGASSARRVEHRVAGADANPYLVLAALLAGVHHGIDSGLDPGPPFDGNASEVPDEDLPCTWEKSLDRARASAVLARLLGQEYLELYCNTKRAEMLRFLDHVSAREYAWYL